MRNAIWIICTALLSLTPLTASAQGTTTPTNGTSTNGGLGLTKADFVDMAFMYRKDKDSDWVFMNKTTFDTFFNRRRCECDEEIQVRVSLLAASRSKISGKMGTIKLRAGDETCVCQGAACNGSLCGDLSPAQDMAGLINGNLDFKFNVSKLFAAGRAAGTDGATICERDDNQNVYIWIDGPDSDTTSDVTDASVQVKLDGIAPPAPKGITAVGGEEALQVSWQQIPTTSDMQGYQVVCARGESTPVFADPPTARFSAPGLCSLASSTSDGGAPASADAGAGADAGATDAGATVNALTAADLTTMPLAQTSDDENKAEYGPAPAMLATLDPKYVCSDLLRSGTEARLFRLQNGVPYVVGVVAVDLRGNPSKLTDVVLQRPVPTKDFYSGYRSAGGAAEGGYCTLAGAGDSRQSRGARASWQLLGLGLVALALRGGRQRRDGARGARR
jgi:hypothetical protein